MSVINKVSILSTAIFRIPKFPINARLEDNWSVLKQAIEESSPAFYEVIKDLEYKDYSKQPEKIKHTIAKYFNRAKFRPVPYGSFASVGTVNLDSRTAPVLLKNETLLHSFADWASVNELEYEFDEVVARNAKIFANSTWYPVGTNIRYICQKQDGSYELAELPSSPSILCILQNCKKPTPYSLLIGEPAPDLQDQTSTMGLIEEMIAARLLITELDKNIIGPDYFQRMNYSGNILPDNRYTIAERQPEYGNLDIRLLKHLPELVSLLQHLCPKATLAPLEDFKTRFLKKFDQREVPLMIALDPELGIGYNNTTQSSQGDDLIQQIIALQKAKVQSEQDFKSVFMGQLTVPSQIINLENIKPVQKEALLPLPNTLSVILTQCGNDIIVEHIGSATATALAGRFTRIDGSIYKHALEIARLEQDANSDVLFFDIGYTSELKVDNVNRRDNIYPLQLNILNYDTTDDPLTADDILVCVRNNNIILRSKSRSKRVIPRHASAYNYSRSDLALFRFLCDLSYQDIQGNLNLDLRSICPGFHYYPRIQFKNLVVTPASVVVEDKALSSRAELLNYIQSHITTRHAKFGKADQKLVINLENADDIEMLYAELKKARLIWLEEAFIDESQVLQDQSGNPFYSQFLITLFHKQSIYPPVSGAYNGAEKVRSFHPGSQWLFFQIHTHPMRSDYILTEYIQPFLNQNNELINKWFFIRYNEGGDHLRLRLQVKEGTLSGDLMEQFHKLLGPELESGTVTDIQIRTYEREMERYGPDFIEEIECHFFNDSTYVFTLFQCSLTDDQKYGLCLDLMRDIQSAGVLEAEPYLALVKSVYESFRNEFNVNAETTKKIAVRYDTLLEHPAVPLSPGTAHYLQQFKESFIDALFQRPVPERRRLLIDLLHMHVNRLFSENQRAHEMVIYYLLIRDWYHGIHVRSLGSKEKQAGI
ncbi:thiopeptide-type bacteriocin biosynthesis protein [Chitinophaga sp. RCC_12]|uniref:lantibiotic dehydratase n=1 Tax=Chitinophaga sp. RCC_12 TaxID=3239226 RepID=UPI003526B472